MPRRSVTKYSQNEAGWPQTTKDSLNTGRKGSLDWSELFGFREGLFTTLLVSDTPELERSLREISDRALNDDELLYGLSMLAPFEKAADERRQQVEFETVRRLIGTILNRADSVGAENDEQLRQIYSELEKARFSPELEGDVVVPLVAVSFAVQEPLQIDDDVWIEPLNEADHRSRALEWLRSDGVDPYVAAAATHAVVRRNVLFTNNVHRYSDRTLVRKELSIGVVESVAEAVDVVSELNTGYAQVLVRPHGWVSSWTEDLPPLWSAWTGRAYPEVLNDRTWDKTFEPMTADDAAKVARIARSLRSAPNNIRIATRRCRRVGFRDDAEDRLLDVAIGLEALLGKESDALTHRLAQRAAVALSDLLPPENTYSLVKQFYGVRSRIAHGAKSGRMTCKLGNNEWEAYSVGLYILRELLKSNLLSDEPWDPESLDAQMLAALGGSES